MTLTNLLLFLILVTLATYTFMPWKGIDKGSLVKVASQWFMWFAVFFWSVVVRPPCASGSLVFLINKNNKKQNTAKLLKQ